MSCENQLIKYLEDATSQNLHVLKAAEEQLKVWEQQPKFYQAILVCLINIIIVGLMHGYMEKL